MVLHKLRNFKLKDVFDKSTIHYGNFTVKLFFINMKIWSEKHTRAKLFKFSECLKLNQLNVTF